MTQRPSTLIFHCPACDHRLQVRAAMGGVAGPCPTCRAVIRAPALLSLAETEAPQAGLAPLPQAAPVPIEPRPASRPAPAPRLATARPMPLPSAAAVGAQAGRPEAQIAAPTVPVQSRRVWLRFRGLLIPFGLVLACAGLIIGTVLLVRPPQGPDPDSTPVPGIGQTPASGLWPFVPKPAAEPEPAAPAADDPSPGDPAPEDDPAPPADPVAPAEVPANLAAAVADRFLAATSLEERLPLMLSSRSSEELSTTSLAGALPSPGVPILDLQVSAPDELLTEFFFRVPFPAATPPQPFLLTMAVRQRGTEDPPLVLADPFIDLFDGALARFGESPSAEARRFHGLLEALPLCDTNLVPDPERMITLRLRPHATAKELAKAYVSRTSSVGQMIAQPGSPLRWGQPTPAIVTLRWNRTDPKRPFLELVRLDALTWSR